MEIKNKLVHQKKMQKLLNYIMMQKTNGKDGSERKIWKQQKGQEFSQILFQTSIIDDFNGKIWTTYEKNGSTFALKAIEVTYQGTINENAILRPGDPGYPEDADAYEEIEFVEAEEE